MERLELPDVRRHHLIEALQIWKYAIPDARHAALPPHTQRPNPLIPPQHLIAVEYSLEIAPGFFTASTLFPASRCGPTRSPRAGTIR